MRLKLLPLCAMVASMLVLCEAQAHPFAVTTTEVEYNSESHCFEVAMRIYPEQLEQALRNETGLAIRLDRTADIDPLIVPYLSSQFSIESNMSRTKQTPSTSVRPIRWIGKEVTEKCAWLYFEIPFEGPLNGIVVKNTMFLQINPEQLNTVYFTAKDRTASVALSKHEPQSLVRWQATAKGKPAKPNQSLRF